MKKFFRKYGRGLQALYVFLFFSTLVVIGCSKDKSPYENVNRHKGSIILKIDYDIIKDDYHYWVKSKNGYYEDFLIDEEYGDIFEKGDMI